MKLISLIFLLLSCLNSRGQKSNPCNCKGFIDTSYNGTLYLKDSPKEQIIESIPYQHKKGNYLLFDISQVADSFFFVKMKYTLTGKTYQGWLRKAKYLNTYIKRDSLELTLFYEASYTSKIRTKTSNKKAKPFQIFNCTQNWLYIKKNDKDSKFEGWIHSQNQCSNPTTTCK